jgi:hypothetical protein
MRREREEGVSLSTLSRQYGVCLRSVHDICARKAWRHVP